MFSGGLGLASAFLGHALPVDMAGTFPDSDMLTRSRMGYPG